MNALELADKAESVQTWEYGTTDEWIEEAAAMLRQQQAEIEALKQIIDANNLNQNIGQFVKPTNEPVAWRGKKFYETQEGWFYNENEIGEPLYTHPVKELTDDEIEEFAYAFQLWQLHNPDKALEGIMDFARAILRKAQENDN